MANGCGGWWWTMLHCCHAREHANRHASTGALWLFHVPRRSYPRLGPGNDRRHNPRLSCVSRSERWACTILSRGRMLALLYAALPCTMLHHGGLHCQASAHRPRRCPTPSLFAAYLAPCGSTRRARSRQKKREKEKKSHPLVVFPCTQGMPHLIWLYGCSGPPQEYRDTRVHTTRVPSVGAIQCKRQRASVGAIRQRDLSHLASRRWAAHAGIRA